MRIAIATDHNGVKEKEYIINTMSNYDFVDLSKDNNPTDDYPDFAKRVADYVVNNENALGVLMCGTGIGMSIAANKVKGIRCAHCSTIEQAHLAKEHNNANIIALSYKDPKDKLVSMIEEFINTPFSNEERHARRVQKIIDMEN
jgi:ribose 5-phosphate isomerase B